jgi:hypothetical protein
MAWYVMMFVGEDMIGIVGSQSRSSSSMCVR